jgi:predicted transcriptional regulator
MERLHSLRPAASILLIFSEKHFSTQDIENFKAILPMSESLVKGDIEAVRPHLTSGKLLVVLDSRGNVIWHEEPGMNEQQVLNEISNLLQTTSN